MFRLVAFIMVFSMNSIAGLITEEDARDFCLNHWFPALQLGNDPSQLESKLDHLMNFYTEGIRFTDPNNTDSFGVPVLTNKDLVRKYYRAVLSKYPLWEFDILAIHPTDKGFVLHYRGRKAPPVESFEGVDILELEGVTPESKVDTWRISRISGFYDRVPFRPQSP